MTYLALARKFRPRTFNDLLGQDILVQALTQSLTKNKLHHAYLFTGSHGIGKTSVARLFAKALNCEKGISANPCLSCNTCLSIEKGSYIDLLEVDGASKTKVEETRDLLDNAQYLPSLGRFKIYLIDEVHMLSQHSFNALLKTLEEPPSHVKFLLATTDPQKLPATIISRCLQFHLKPLSTDLIVANLEKIAQEEGVAAEKAALLLIANAARGSVRDSLSLLEQAINCSSFQITAKDVKSMLGYTQQEYALRILYALAENRAEELFSISDEIAKEGGNYPYVLETLWHEVYQLAKLKHLKQTSSCPKTAFLIEYFLPETIQLLYQIVLKGLDDLKFAPHLKIGFEMCLLRMLAFQPASEVEPFKEVTRERSGEKLAPPNLPVGDLLNALNLKGMTLNAAMQARLIEVSDAKLILGINKSHATLFTANVIKQLEKACSAHFNRSMQVVLNMQNDKVEGSPLAMQNEKKLQALQQEKQALATDVGLQSFKQTFNAEEI
ncbi:MAG: DNA polymerase III, subunit gamma and tau [Legionellales bacterium RIFCSPHIGHO2_12_FULL_37_14]|nr:MAG: DNA polymerase III, subunit gamma and tau [Legionellales bacterium RIFCSPHIGHO2_12_FULL_37_14]